MSFAFVPGRANLIGEHLDYNDGAALPFAVQYGVNVTTTPTKLQEVTVDSEGFGRWSSREPATQEWSLLAQAVIEALGSSSQAISVSSDLPIGAGLSSSAAYLGALALALDAPGDLKSVATFLQSCESSAGHNVGLLDQFATLGARSGHALLIDFQTLEFRDVLVPDSLSFTAVDTGVRRRLATTQYAQRRHQCAIASEQIGALRCATPGDLEAIADSTVRSRARHVMTEYQRVLHAVSALESDDARRVGELVSESHHSLSQDFEVSTPEIDKMVSEIIQLRGVYGARLVGGGFGGCVLVVHEPGLQSPWAKRAHWPLDVASGAFERIGRSRIVS